MKKPLQLLTLILFFTGQMALAQGSFGIRGGLNFSTASMNSLFPNGSNPANVAGGGVGYHFGFYGVMDFELFKIQPEVNYSIQRTEFDLGNLNDPSYNISSIQIPILGRFDFVDDALFVYAGPRFGIPLVSKIESPGGAETDIKDATKGLEFSFVLGATAVIPIPDNEVGVSFRYIKGFTNMISDPVSSGPTRYVGNLFQLSASYAFNSGSSNSRRRR